MSKFVDNCWNEWTDKGNDGLTAFAEFVMERVKDVVKANMPSKPESPMSKAGFCLTGMRTACENILKSLS